jgi:protein disulfide-isomerase A6
LTGENFDELVYGDKDAWFIEFYAPWCGHCKNLTPEWAALATSLKGEIKVAKVDATQNQELASRFGVRGYPSIKFFKPGQKEDSSAVDYEGGRSESAMAEWARAQTSDLKIFSHIQLTSQSVYDEHCKGRNLCVINFLPSTLDSTAE